MDSWVFRTAIIGLGRSDVLMLHDTFNQLLSSHQFEWVSADHPQLDFLIINNFFINSTSITKLIERHQAPYLIVDRQDASVSVEDQTLHLPIKETSSLKQWVERHLTQRHPPSTLQYPTAPTTKNKGVEAPAPVAYATTPKTQSFNEHNLLGAVQAILAIKQGKWLLSDATRTVALLDLSNKLVWIETPKSSTSNLAKSDQLRLPLQLKETYQSLSHAQPHDLKQWLWQLLWQFSQDFALVAKDVPIKLLLWPQPVNAAQQALLLKSCALLKHQALNAEQLSRMVDIALRDAQKLLTALLAVEFAVKVSAAEQSVAPPIAASTAQDPKVLKGFLSKLRHKLGF